MKLTTKAPTPRNVRVDLDLTPSNWSYAVAEPAKMAAVVAWLIGKLSKHHPMLGVNAQVYGLMAAIHVDPDEPTIRTLHEFVDTLRLSIEKVIECGCPRGSRACGGPTCSDCQGLGHFVMGEEMRNMIAKACDAAGMKLTDELRTLPHRIAMQEKLANDLHAQIDHLAQAIADSFPNEPGSSEETCGGAVDVACVLLRRYAKTMRRDEKRLG